MIKLIKDFITEKEEKELLSHLPRHQKQSGVARNAVKRYGSTLPYNGRHLSIPEYFYFLLGRLEEAEIINSDSITVNEYFPSQYIDWHIDSPTSGPVIVVLSLKSQATMLLRHDNDQKAVSLPARSLLIMDGEERNEWEHSIEPVVNHRYSIVFRKGTKQ